ncbi:MAG TPA: hypothetical protein PLG90_13435, partial [Ignavibacteria bacterium]|nr:hypothetical protein [Ignavibacteria bacterium]
HKTYKIINDISNSKYYLIYKINLDAFLYVTTIFDNSEIFSNNQIDLTLGFFEPISDTNIFELIQDLDNIDSNFVKSDSLNELFEIK